MCAPLRIVTETALLQRPKSGWRGRIEYTHRFTITVYFSIVSILLMTSDMVSCNSNATAPAGPTTQPSNVNPFNTAEAHQNFVKYLHTLSGQTKVQMRSQIDHSYAKPWNQHPDPDIRAKPARFLFMNGFPKHLNHSRVRVNQDVMIDVVSGDEENDKRDNPLANEINFNATSQSSSSEGKGKVSDKYNSGPGLESDDLWGIVDKQPINKIGWTPKKSKLYSKSLKILHSDRLARLNAEGKPNDFIIKRNILEKSAMRFRQLFSSIAQWDPALLTWLHSTLHTYVITAYLICYHESMQLLRQKMTNLIDRFYSPIKLSDGTTYTKQKVLATDPAQAVVNNHKPKRIAGSPLFLIVPSAPQMPHHLTSTRLKHWNNLFGALGKVITVSVPAREARNRPTASETLNDIRAAVKERITDCKKTFSESRPLVLVGFGSSSLIAAHCALENSSFITATVCLGFPLTGVNGFRGDLDDPLLETNVPTMFVIGQNSSMCTLDDMEDFRERITKTITGLVVVGGCNDRLILCNAKKRTETITQPLVDRCVADEIYEFVSFIINPNHSSESSKSHKSSHSSSSTSHKEPATPTTPSTPATPSNAAGKGHNFSSPSKATPPIDPVSLASLKIDSLKNRPLTVPGVVKRKKNPVRPEKIQAMSAPPTPPSSASSFYTVNSATLSERLQQTGAHQWSVNSLKKIKLESRDSDSKSASETPQISPVEKLVDKKDDKGLVESDPSSTSGKTCTSTTCTPSPAASASNSAATAAAASPATAAATATPASGAVSDGEKQEKPTKESQVNYPIAPVQAISAASTRTGRTIKVPSKLDM